MPKLRSYCVIAVFSAMAVSATPALADGPYRKAPREAAGPYDRPLSWSGFYVGGHLGGAWSDTDWSFFNGVNTEDFGQSASGVMAGGQAGAHVQWGAVVAGVEISFSSLNLRDTTTSVLNVDRSRAVDIDDLLLITGRLGYAAGPWLIYGKGGFASADVEFRTFVTSTGAPTTRSGERENGWTVGAGMEYALHPNATIGIEYNFVRLDIDDRNQFVFPGFIAPERVTDAETDIQTVMARLNFKFGGW